MPPLDAAWLGRVFIVSSQLESSGHVVPRWFCPAPLWGRFMGLQFQKRARIGTKNRIAYQGLGVRWVRGEGTHRFGLNARPEFQSGVSPVPRQPPHSKTLRRFAWFMENVDDSKSALRDLEPMDRSADSLVSLVREFQG